MHKIKVYADAWSFCVLEKGIFDMLEFTQDRGMGCLNLVINGADGVARIVVTPEGLDGSVQNSRTVGSERTRQIELVHS